jgi:hypothetical protein
MLNRVVISNVVHFRRYMTVRYALVGLFFVTTFLSLTSFGSSSWISTFQLLAILGLGLLALFEYVKRPALLELRLSPQGGRGLSVYYPDVRFFQLFRYGQVRPLVIAPGDTLLLLEVPGAYPWLKKVRFTIVGENEVARTTRLLDFGWATPAEHAALLASIDGNVHNRPGSSSGNPGVFTPQPKFL